MAASDPNFRPKRGRTRAFRRAVNRLSVDTYSPRARVFLFGARASTPFRDGARTLCARALRPRRGSNETAALFRRSAGNADQTQSIFSAQTLISLISDYPVLFLTVFGKKLKFYARKRRKRPQGRDAFRVRKNAGAKRSRRPRFQPTNPTWSP